MNRGSILRFLALALVALGSACTLGDAEAPPLSGPSELGLSFAMTASPDVLSQDGASQALVAVTAYDSNGQPARNVQIRAEIEVNGVITDFGSISARSIVTDNNGHATITYTAPAAPIVAIDSGTRVTIRMTPVNGNFADAVTRVVEIRLVPPGVIGGGSGPTAAFTVSPLPRAFSPVTFDGSTSKAGAAPIVSFGWNFGDGSIGSGQTVIHQYSTQGTFSVTLTVTDNNGFTGSTSQFVALGPGTAPTAGFTFSPSTPRVDQEIVFNGGPSTPGAGHTIVGYDWNFGGGSGRSGVLVTKAYDTAGTYPVVLTVTDEVGQTASQVQVVTVAASSQTASFTSSPTSPHPGTVVNFNASASTASPGTTIVNYAWDFGDGATSPVNTTPTAAHPFGSVNTYTVRLTTTDSLGRTATTTGSVIVVP